LNKINDENNPNTRKINLKVNMAFIISLSFSLQSIIIFCVSEVNPNLTKIEMTEKIAK
jgi:hypothetical protein